MKKIFVPLILLTLASTATAWSQSPSSRSSWHASGYYVMLGSAQRPTFSDFFNYLNRVYQPAQKPRYFGSNVSMGIGYLNRFHRFLALDIGFSIYNLKSKAQFQNNNSEIAETTIREELHYQAAIFSATMPIFFDFSPRQRVVPYVGLGISVFSMRLDHYRDSYSDSATLFSDNLRDSRLAIGAHVESGLYVKLTRHFAVDLRGRWHTGDGSLATLENGFKDFDIKQDVAQLNVGINYFLR